MRNFVFVAAALGLAVGVSGCATVTRGTTTEFNVTSTPPDASVKTSTGFSCDSTPCGMKMPRKKAFDVTVSKPGYVSKTTHITSGVAAAGGAGMAGNLVLGGVVGMVVDGTSGAMNDLTPNPLHVDLEAEKTADAPSAPAPALAANDPAPTKP